MKGIYMITLFESQLDLFTKAPKPTIKDWKSEDRGIAYIGDTISEVVFEVVDTSNNYFKIRLKVKFGELSPEHDIIDYVYLQYKNRKIERVETFVSYSIFHGEYGNQRDTIAEIFAWNDFFSFPTSMLDEIMDKLDNIFEDRR